MVKCVESCFFWICLSIIIILALCVALEMAFWGAQKPIFPACPKGKSSSSYSYGWIS